jgi:hypothetical protein
VHLTPTHQALEQHTVLAGLPCRRHSTSMSSMPRCRPPERPPWARGRRPPMPADHHGCGIHAARRSRSPRAAATPDVAARTGPQRPRSGPVAMRHHDTGASPPAAATTSRPPHRRHAPSLRRHTPPPPRPRALTMRRRESERDPAPVVSGASFARPCPPTEAGGEGRKAGLWQRLGFHLLCRPSGGDTGGVGKSP